MDGFLGAKVANVWRRCKDADGFVSLPRPWISPPVPADIPARGRRYLCPRTRISPHFPTYASVRFRSLFPLFLLSSSSLFPLLRGLCGINAHWVWFRLACKLPESLKNV